VRITKVETVSSSDFVVISNDRTDFRWKYEAVSSRSMSDEYELDVVPNRL